MLNKKAIRHYFLLFQGRGLGNVEVIFFYTFTSRVIYMANSSFQNQLVMIRKAYLLNMLLLNFLNVHTIMK